MASDIWKEKSNAQYQKVIGTIVSLATAALVLPVLFLKDFIRIPAEDRLIEHLSGTVYAAWAFLAISILLGTGFYYFSGKWLKNAYGGSTNLDEAQLECALDWTFWLSIGSLLLGLGMLIGFLVRYSPGS